MLPILGVDGLSLDFQNIVTKLRQQRRGERGKISKKEEAYQEAKGGDLSRASMCTRGWSD
jgi:hypothetical protein